MSTQESLLPLFDRPRRENQTDMILSHLKSGRTINPLESLRLYGCFRLGARCWDLRKLGHKIEKEMIDVGNGKHVAQYRLVNAETDTSLSHKQGSAQGVAESGLL